MCQDHYYYIYVDSVGLKFKILNLIELRLENIIFKKFESIQANQI